VFDPPKRGSNMNGRSTTAVFSAFLLASTLALACSDRSSGGPGQRAGAKMDDGLERLGEKMQDAGEEMQEKARGED
jgi:hypothetical protein